MPTPNNQLKPLVTKAIVAIIACVAMWRFGIRIEDGDMTGMVDQLVGVALGWMAFEKPGAAKLKPVAH